MTDKPTKPGKSMRSLNWIGLLLTTTSIIFAYQFTIIAQAFVVYLVAEKEIAPVRAIYLGALLLVVSFLGRYFAQKWVGAMFTFKVKVVSESELVAGWPCVWVTNGTGELTEVKVVFELLKDHGGADILVESKTKQIGGMLSTKRKKKHDRIAATVPEFYVKNGRHEGYSVWVTVSYIHLFTNYRGSKRRQIPRELLQNTGNEPNFLPPEEQRLPAE